VIHLKLFREYIFVQDQIDRLYPRAKALQQDILARHGNSTKASETFRKSEAFQDLKFYEERQERLFVKITKTYAYKANSLDNLYGTLKRILAESMNNTGFGSDHYKKNR
jgi:hypothetical protein